MAQKPWQRKQNARGVWPRRQRPGQNGQGVPDPKALAQTETAGHKPGPKALAQTETAGHKPGR
jgi:hypothetical protein